MRYTIPAAHLVPGQPNTYRRALGKGSHAAAMDQPGELGSRPLGHHDGDDEPAGTLPAAPTRTDLGRGPGAWRNLQH